MCVAKAELCPTPNPNVCPKFFNHKRKKTMSDTIHTMLNELNSAFGAFQQANDERLKALEKNTTDPLATEKVERLNTLMDNLTANLNKEKKSQTTTHRPFLSDTCDDKDALEVKAFRSYLKTGHKNIEKKYLNTSALEEGGCFLPRSIYANITSTLEDICPMMSLANVVHLESGKGTVYRYPRIQKEFDDYWKDAQGKNRWEKGMEDSEKQEGKGFQTPKIEMMEIPLHAIHYIPRISWDLIENSEFDVVSWLQTGLTEYIGMLCNEAFIHGDGTKKPKGIAHADYLSDAPEKYKITLHKTGADSNFKEEEAYTQLLDVMTSLDARYAKGAQWLISNQVMKTIRLIKAPGEERYLWSPEKGNATAGSSLLGYPVTVCDDLPALSEKLTSLFFGNFKEAYTIVHRPNMSIIRDEWSSKPDIELLLRYAFGGAVTNGSALKALKFEAGAEEE